MPLLPCPDNRLLDPEDTLRSPLPGITGAEVPTPDATLAAGLAAAGVPMGTDSCVATVLCDGVLCMLIRSLGAPGAAAFDGVGLLTVMAWAELRPLALAATLSRPVRVLSSEPRLLKGGNALTLAYVSDELRLSPIILPPIERAPPREGVC